MSRASLHLRAPGHIPARRRAALAAVLILSLAGASAPSLASPPPSKPVPWACKAIEQPVLDRSASAHATPIKYDDLYFGPLHAIEGYGRAHPEAWADLYIDHSPQGSGDPIFIHVLLTKDVDHHARAMRKLVPHPRAVIFSRAAATKDELRRTAGQIEREQFADVPSPDFGAEAVDLFEDPSKNRLEIGLRDYKASAAEAMHERYGPRVCVSLRDMHPSFRAAAQG
jgi:hypothetical protein